MRVLLALGSFSDAPGDKGVEWRQLSLSAHTKAVLPSPKRERSTA